MMKYNLFFVFLLMTSFSCSQKNYQSSNLEGLYKMGEPGQIMFAGTNIEFLPNNQFIYSTFNDMLIRDADTGKSYFANTKHGKGVFSLHESQLILKFRNLSEIEMQDASFKQKYLGEGDELVFDFKRNSEIQIGLKTANQKEYVVYSLYKDE